MSEGGELPIHRLCAIRAARAPDAVAVVCGAAALSYRQLDRRSNRLAHELRRRGVTDEARVGICARRGWEMVVGVLGILKAGGAYVPLDPDTPAERLGLITEDSRARLLLAHGVAAEKLAGLRAPVLSLDGGGASGGCESPPAAEIHPQQLAYVIYTSGSSGRPKGVEISHRALAYSLTALNGLLGLRAEDRLVAATTLAFDIANLELLLPLAAGARVVVASRTVAREGGALRRLLADAGATVFQATPSGWRLLLAAGWQGETPLKALCGGEVMTPRLLEALRARAPEVWNLYGPTEATIWCSAHRAAADEAPPVPVGRPLAGTTLHLLDGELRPVPEGGTGELLVAGPGLGRGYAGRPAPTAASFLPAPAAREPGERLYRTGDLARRRPDGSFEFHGRKDDQLKIRGARVEPGEIEAALEEHPAVLQAAVVGVESKGDRLDLAAYVVPRAAAQPPTEEALGEHLGRKLPEHAVPRLFELRAALPLGPGGKVDRRALRQTRLPAAPTVLESPLFRGFAFVTGLAEALLLPVASALLLAWALAAGGLLDEASPLLWIGAAPLLYLLWLSLFLVLSAAEMSVLGLFFRKPRRLRTADGTGPVLRFLVAGKIYQRFALVFTLPGIHYLLRVPPFDHLILRAYAPRARLGKGAVLLGVIYDPDLTVIGEGAVLGGWSAIAAHTFTRTPRHGQVYVTAPVEIGPRANVGGNAVVSLGTKVGADAVIEPGSVVAPYTRIGAGEVWGGNPAVFRHRRPDVPPAVAASPARDAGPPDLRALLAAALNLPRESVDDSLGSDNCPEWDSLGRMAIAAALADRCGLALSPEEIVRLDSFRDVRRAVEARGRTGRTD